MPSSATGLSLRRHSVHNDNDGGGRSGNSGNDGNGGNGGIDRRLEEYQNSLSRMITLILLEHFGDGVPVHAVVIMDTVQYRLAQDDMATVLRNLRDRLLHGTYGDGADTGDGHDDGDEYDRPYYYRTADKGRPEYCVWADRRVSRVYHGCLMQLLQSGRIRVVYDCGGGCGECLEDDSSSGRGRRCVNGCDDSSDPAAAVTATKTNREQDRRQSSDNKTHPFHLL